MADVSQGALGMEGTTDASRDVVARRARQKRSRVVLEADGVIKSRRLGSLLEKATDPSVLPPQAPSHSSKCRLVVVDPK